MRTKRADLPRLRARSSVGKGMTTILRSIGFAPRGSKRSLARVLRGLCAGALEAKDGRWRPGSEN